MAISKPAVNAKPASRFQIPKAIRRTLRSISTETRFLISQSTTAAISSSSSSSLGVGHSSSSASGCRRRRSCQSYLLILIVVSLAVLFLIFSLTQILRWLLPVVAPVLAYYEPRRETHFTRRVHVFLPRPEKFEAVRNRACSWLYVEFGAKDGRHLDGFLSNGNQFLEEYLRATQSSLRAFCAMAFEPDPALTRTLSDVRTAHGKRVGSLDVFTQIVPGARDGTEALKFRNVDTNEIPEDEIPATSVALKPFLLNITLPIEKSGKDVKNMVTARGNGNVATVVVRFNDLTVSQALWYLDLMEAGTSDGVLCRRVDRLILDFEIIRLDAESLQGYARNREVVRDWERITTSPSDRQFNPTDDMNVIVRVARAINDRLQCRTTVHVLDRAGKMLVPTILSEREIFYAVLAGEPTFNERVAAQTETWMTAIPQDRVTIFTNADRTDENLAAARGRNVAVIHPYRPEIETHLPLMQSWSHLVRTRESWDRVMRDDPSIKWLALVDDDTFVFPGGMREYLSSFDSRTPLWGGSGEQARIDNGDSGQFALWLRRIHEKYGGRHCYLSSETVPKHLQGSHIEFSTSQVLNGRQVAHKVSHMCHDLFCHAGCPAVPQGAAIFVSRALVEALRPHIETCERDTSRLCRNCGSQRLFMCVNWFTKHPRTVLARGICRAPWKLEHRERFPFALTYHGFTKYRGISLSTKSLGGDMVQLWELAKSHERDVKRGLQASNYVPMSDVANMIACRNKGRYESGSCITPDGKRFQANDGKSKKKPSSPRQPKVKSPQKPPHPAQNQQVPPQAAVPPLSNQFPPQ